MMRPYSLNIRGSLREFSHPAVMGILNVTPDSFYGESRAMDAAAIARRVAEMIEEGADIIDVGGYSTRPGHSEVDVDEEIRRVSAGIAAVRKISTDVIVSVDTFRPEVARVAVSDMGAEIVNDVSGMSDEMLQTMSSLNVPYVLTYNKECDDRDICQDMLYTLSTKVASLNLAGVNDIIVDPGFGFNKSMDQNFEILRLLSILQYLRLPVLVGLSRKSMLCQLLSISGDEALEATVAANTIALVGGAAILRVHDVKSARQTVTILDKVNPLNATNN